MTLTAKRPIKNKAKVDSHPSFIDIQNTLHDGIILRGNQRASMLVSILTDSPALRQTAHLMSREQLTKELAALDTPESTERIRKAYEEHAKFVEATNYAGNRVAFTYGARYEAYDVVQEKKLFHMQ